MLYMADAYMGKAHVTADQIGDYNAGVSGSGCVLNVGEQLRAEIVNANLVRIYDGAFIFQGYRRSGITAGSYEDVTIENGTQAQKRNDLICAKYEKDSTTSKENLTLVVIKGTPGDTASDPAIPEGDVRSGSAVCYMPLYRVKLDGINLTAVEKLFTVRKTLEEIEGDVAALNSQMFTDERIVTLTKTGSWSIGYNLGNKKLIQIIALDGVPSIRTSIVVSKTALSTSCTASKPYFLYNKSGDTIAQFYVENNKLYLFAYGGYIIHAYV